MKYLRISFSQSSLVVFAAKVTTDDDGVVVAVFYSRTGEVCVVGIEREDPHLSAFVSAKWTNASFTFFPPGKLWFPDKNILAI